MFVSEEFLDDFSFSSIVLFMKNVFVGLEISLIASFSTSVILLELDPLFLKEGFTDLQKLLISVTLLFKGKKSNANLLAHLNCHLLSPST